MPELPAPPRQADRLFWDVLSPEPVRKLRMVTREVAERDVAPLAREIGSTPESAESFPWEAFRALAAADLFGVPYGPEHGHGLEHPCLATATVVEELAYVSSSVASVYDGQAILAGRVLEAGGVGRIQRDYLRPLIAGDVVASFATTEPEASSDLSPEALQTVAERSSAGWVISGRKRFITNSPVADFVVALIKTGKGLSFFLVPLKDTPGARVGRPDRKLGQRGQLTADIYLENVEVPEDHLLGEEGAGLRLGLGVLTYSRVAIAAAAVGLAQSAFDLATAHLAQRRAFKKRLAEFQHWQFRMAEHATSIENARTLYQKAALRIDSGARYPEPEAAMAKSYCTAISVDVARDAIQAFGGYGFISELACDGTIYKLEEIYRDTKIGEIYEGATEIQKWLIARQIFGRDITG